MFFGSAAEMLGIADAVLTVGIHRHDGVMKGEIIFQILQSRAECRAFSAVLVVGEDDRTAAGFLKDRFILRTAAVIDNDEEKIAQCQLMQQVAKQFIRLIRRDQGNADRFHGGYLPSFQ